MTGMLNMQTRHDDHEEDLPIAALGKELSVRAKQRAAIEELMEKFTGRLFDAFERSIAQTTAQGIPGFGKPRRVPHPAGGWRQALQIFIEDWSIIVVPLVGAAWPNPRDEARIDSFRFKEPCGRIAMFVGDDPTTESFYDFLLFADASWFAWGFGWPRIAADIDSTNFDRMAFELLLNIVRDVHTTWRPRRIGGVAASTSSGTALSQSLDAKKRAYNYGLPGDE